MAISYVNQIVKINSYNIVLYVSMIWNLHS